MDVEEMVTSMDYGGTSGNLNNDCQRAYYLQVAWLLREKLNELLDGDKGKFPESRLHSLLDMAASRNIVSVDPKTLNPFLWRTLSKDLLHLVLARLSVPDITRLRCLSREWRKDMATANSEIHQACHEANPTMFALLSQSSTTSFLVTIFDIKKCRWHYTYQLHLQRRWNGDLKREWPLTWTAVDECDGGLVCFFSLWKPTKSNPLSIVVVNLLTRVQHELPPPHYLYSTLPTMVQIKVDSHTKCYRVMVAGYESSVFTIQIYDSSTRKWTKTPLPCGSIFGPVYVWVLVNGWYLKSNARKTLIGAYDFAQGKLELFDCKSIGETMIGWVLEKDRMFGLQEHMQMDPSHRATMQRGFCIKEYHVENQTKGCVQGKSYECPFPEALIVQKFSSMILNACDGFLVVNINNGRRTHSRTQHFWLLNLSTSEWSKLPETPKDLHTIWVTTIWGFAESEAFSNHTIWGTVLCRALWNVMP